MSARQSTGDDRARLFWDNFLISIYKKGVEPPFDRCYVKRAEELITASRGKRLAAHEPADLESYLRGMGRKQGLKDWQFRQIVDALQNLFEQVGVAWHSDFNWEHWKDSARSLGKTHPTVARSYDEIKGRTLATEHTDKSKYRLEEIRRSHPELLQTLRSAARRRGLSIRTEQTYEHWILRFVAFHHDVDPRGLGTQEVSAFLDYLALRRNVAAGTQNLALNALVFLYREVLDRTELDFGDFARAKRPRRLPTVLNRSEMVALLSKLEGTHRLMAGLMYGTGMRLMECTRLRVQDIDFEYRQIIVRNAKGGKDRVVPLPDKAASPHMSPGIADPGVFAAALTPL